jgi:type II secretory pathway pseudopilin PulG
MKPQLQPNRPQRSRGITLIECLVYISVLGVVLGLGTTAFYACFNNMKALRRNADDITRTLTVGELWRRDIRAATQPVQFDLETQVLRIARGDTQVSYKFSETAVLRQAKADVPWVTILPNVQRSEMAADARAKLTAWRWDLELKPPCQAGVTLRPRFSFTAVPGPATP